MLLPIRCALPKAKDQLFLEAFWSSCLSSVFSSGCSRGGKPQALAAMLFGRWMASWQRLSKASHHGGLQSTTQNSKGGEGSPSSLAVSAQPYSPRRAQSRLSAVSRLRCTAGPLLSMRPFKSAPLSEAIIWVKI